VQEGNLKLGSWQMVLWQPRWVFATTDAVCYQKITSDERPIGKEKKIKFTDILKIDELDYGEFQLEVAKRFYTFKAPTSQKCTVRLRETAVCSGLPPAVRFGQEVPAADCPWMPPQGSCLPVPLVTT
jgi:hypothetical protein